MEPTWERPALIATLVAFGALTLVGIVADGPPGSSAIQRRTDTRSSGQDETYSRSSKFGPRHMDQAAVLADSVGHDG